MLSTKPGTLLISAALLTLLVSACSINVKKQKDGQDKKVDISTPLGGIHVSKDADPEDVGVAIYPGAKLKEKGNGEEKSANVNISGFGFGLKVVALEYESNDSPAKILAYYKDQLKRYGNVIECHTSSVHVNTEFKHHNDGAREVTCEGSNGTDVELKVGTNENQHIVAIEPSGSGSSFSLVYVRTHGKDADI